MRYGVLSDIHGNLEAFETAAVALSGEKIDKYLCVGDIVGYGADPAECIKKTRMLEPVTVCGNHDSAVCGLTDIQYFNPAARRAVEWTRKTLSQKDINFLKGLSLVYKNSRFTLVHGTLQNPEIFSYMASRELAAETFALMETDVCFVGHSHIPGIFVKDGGKISYTYEEKVKLRKGEKAIVNAGSIGQPRDGDPRLCYLIYDESKNEIEFKRLPYEIEKTQRKIRDAGLPPLLAERLASGM